jgi:hypothetical protein
LRTLHDNKSKAETRSQSFLEVLQNLSHFALEPILEAGNQTTHTNETTPKHTTVALVHFSGLSSSYQLYVLIDQISVQ